MARRTPRRSRAARWSATLEVGGRRFPVAQKGAWKRIGSTAMPCLAAASTKRSVLARAKWPGSARSPPSRRSGAGCPRRACARVPAWRPGRPGSRRRRPGRSARRRWSAAPSRRCPTTRSPTPPRPEEGRRGGRAWPRSPAASKRLRRATAEHERDQADGGEHREQGADKPARAAVGVAAQAGASARRGRSWRREAQRAAGREHDAVAERVGGHVRGKQVAEERAGAIGTRSLAETARTGPPRPGQPRGKVLPGRARQRQWRRAAREPCLEPYAKPHRACVTGCPRKTT